MAILAGVRCYFIVVLICICLIADDVELLFLYLAIIVSFLGKCLFWASPYFSIGMFVCFFIKLYKILKNILWIISQLYSNIK